MHSAERIDLDKFSRIEAMLTRIVNIQGNQKEASNELIESQLIGQIL